VRRPLAKSIDSGKFVPGMARQPGRHWGIGSPQLAVFDSAGRVQGTLHDASEDEARRQRVRVEEAVLHDTARAIRERLPE